MLIKFKSTNTYPSHMLVRIETDNIKFGNLRTIFSLADCKQKHQKLVARITTYQYKPLAYDTHINTTKMHIHIWQPLKI